jgi:hypothetical protein
LTIVTESDVQWKDIPTTRGKRVSPVAYADWPSAKIEFSGKPQGILVAVSPPGNERELAMVLLTWEAIDVLMNSRRELPVSRPDRKTVGA